MHRETWVRLGRPGTQWDDTVVGLGRPRLAWDGLTRPDTLLPKKLNLGMRWSGVGRLSSAQTRG